MSRHKYQIYKSTGELQPFSAKKLERSLERAGLHFKERRDIAHEVSQQLRPGIRTKDILKKTERLVRQKSPIAATHYTLKNSLIELGPSGFEFEYFVAKYFEEIGYATSVGAIIQGQFVQHEVDVIASKENYQAFVECKFHNTTGRTNDVKITLYVKARWDDLKNGPHGKQLKDFYIASNTSFSKDALEYSKGVGLKLLGVNAPEGESFLDIIKKRKLYPITSLKRLKKKYCMELLQQRIILCKDLLNERSLLQKMRLSEEEIKAIFNDINNLMK
jgi:hypothetical protein